MSFNELNSVEHYIIQKLSGVNLNAADATSPSDAPVVKEDATPYGPFPWQYRSAEALNHPTDQVHPDRDLLESELREALIRLNPKIAPFQDQAVIATDAVIAFKRLKSISKLVRVVA